MSQQINLFNPIFLQQKKIFAARTMAQALMLLLAGALIIAGTAWRSVSGLRQEATDVALQLTKKQARFASATAAFAPRKASPALNGEVAQAEARLAGLRHVTQLIENGNVGNPHGYAEYFRALGRQHQDGLWLTNVTIAGAGMSLQGRALSATLIPTYITRLSGEPVLRGKEFAQLQIGMPAANAPDGTEPARASAPVAGVDPAPALPPALVQALGPAAAAALGPAVAAAFGPTVAPAPAPARTAPVSAPLAAPALAPYVEFSLQANAAEVTP